MNTPESAIGADARSIASAPGTGSADAWSDDGPDHWPRESRAAATRCTTPAAR